MWELRAPKLRPPPLTVLVSRKPPAHRGHTQRVFRVSERTNAQRNKQVYGCSYHPMDDSLTASTLNRLAVPPKPPRSARPLTASPRAVQRQGTATSRLHAEHYGGGRPNSAAVMAAMQAEPKAKILFSSLFASAAPAPPARPPDNLPSERASARRLKAALASAFDRSPIGLVEGVSPLSMQAEWTLVEMGLTHLVKQVATYCLDWSEVLELLRGRLARLWQGVVDALGVEAAKRRAAILEREAAQEDARRRAELGELHAQLRVAERRAVAAERRAATAEEEVLRLSPLTSKVEMQASELAACRSMLEEQSKALAAERRKARECLVPIPSSEDGTEEGAGRSGSRHHISRPSARRTRADAQDEEADETSSRPWGVCEATRITERVLANSKPLNSPAKHHSSEQEEKKQESVGQFMPSRSTPALQQVREAPQGQTNWQVRVGFTYALTASATVDTVPMGLEQDTASSSRDVAHLATSTSEGAAAAGSPALNSSTSTSLLQILVSSTSQSNLSLGVVQVKLRQPASGHDA